MSDVNFEQRFAIRFCFRFEQSAMETSAILHQAYGDSILSKAQIFRWFKIFSEERESIKDEQRSKRPSISRTDEIVVQIVGMIREELSLTTS